MLRFVSTCFTKLYTKVAVLVRVCSLTEAFTNSYVTLLLEEVVILVLDYYFTLVTTLIATFVLFFSAY